MGNYGKLSSLKLDGSFKNTGLVRVYLRSTDDEYLIFDSNRVRAELGISAITGLVVSNITDNVLLENDEINNENDSIINETNVDKQIAITMQGGGKKVQDDVFEFSINGEFSWDVDYNKVCTKWEVNSELSACYGSSECCAFLGMASNGNWDSSFYLSYGRYNSLLDNIVSSQLIYYDVDLSVPYSDIAYSSEVSLEAGFYDEFIPFGDECIESCLISLNDSFYTLVIEVEDSSVVIDSVKYSVEEEVNVSADNITRMNKAPVLVKEIPDVYIEENGRYTLDLDYYFSDDDRLIYYLPTLESIFVNEQKNIVILIYYYSRGCN